MSETERVIISGIDGEELSFNWPGRVLLSIDDEGVSYAVHKGGKWVGGSFDADTQQQEAAREILAAIRTPSTGEEQ